MPPASNQNPLGNSKAAKFVNSNPLAPLADPFAGMGDDQKELHKEVSNNVQDRLEKAMDELKEKHRTGTQEKDDVDRAPTGAAYKELHRFQHHQRKTIAAAKEQEGARRLASENAAVRNAREQLRRLKFDGLEGANADGDDDETNNRSDDSDDDSEYDHLLNEEDDDALQTIRAARLAQLRAQQSRLAQHRALGHGSLRTIKEDEFLKECTGSSKHVAVHFYHDDFERCKIMDFHLRIAAGEHLECKFLRIDAGKTPFFVSKLKIKTLPQLIVFDEGKEVGRLTGFDGLARDKKKPDEWHTGRLQEWIASTGAIRYEKPSEEVEEELKRMGVVMRGSVYSDRERSGMHQEY